MDLINPIVRRWLEDGRSDPDAFWARAAASLPWFRPWDRRSSGSRRRSAGSRAARRTWPATPSTTTSRTGRARPRRAGRPSTSAASGASSPTRSCSSRGRARRRRRCAGMGVGKGDRITIYMPTCPEAIVLMLAAVRIGAIHVVVFAGFGAGALGDRIRGERLEARLHRGRAPSARARTCAEGDRRPARSRERPRRRARRRAGPRRRRRRR